MALLERSDHGAVAHLLLNSDGNLNALSDAMIAALQGAFDQVAEDPAIRVVVIKGSGRAFCAGADLRGGSPGSRGNAPGDFLSTPAPRVTSTERSSRMTSTIARHCGDPGAERAVRSK